METFVVETKLNVRPFQHHILLKAFKYASIVYNRLLHHEKAKLDSYIKDLEVVKLRNIVSKANNNSNIKKVLKIYRKQYQLDKFDIINDVKFIYKDYKNLISSQMAQAIAKRVDGAITKYVEDNKATLHNVKIVNSIESESTTNGIKYDGINVIYNDMLIPIKTKKDNYFYEAIENCKLKYIRIVRRIGKTRSYYVAQFVFIGNPASLKNIKLGEGNVGIDIGTSTIAICSKDDVYIDELSKNIEKLIKK